MTFSSAPRGPGFSRSSRTGLSLPTTSSGAEEITDGQGDEAPSPPRWKSRPGKGSRLRGGRRGDLSSPEHGPVTRHIFTGTESGELRKPGKGRTAPARKAGVRPLPPPLSIRPSEVVVLPSAPTKPELPPHPNPSAPGDLRLRPYSHRCPNIPRCLPDPAGQLSGPAVAVWVRTAPPSRDHCPLELLPASWHSREARGPGQHLLGL